MPKTIADEHVALVAFDSPPADPAAITAAEWNAATPLQCNIMDYRLSPTDPDTVSQSELCRGSNAQVPTRSNYEGSITVFRYLDTDGKPDTDDAVYDLFREKGTTLYLADREGPEQDADGAAGQEYSYFEVLTGDPKKPTDRGGYVRREVTLYVQRAELDKEIAGES